MSGSGSSVYGIFDEEPLNENQFEGCFVAGGYLD
jgi:4-diphosphocytidyl-2C-methyl-D-erythritol kinase